MSPSHINNATSSTPLSNLRTALRPPTNPWRSRSLTRPLWPPNRHSAEGDAAPDSPTPPFLSLCEYYHHPSTPAANLAQCAPSALPACARSPRSPLTRQARSPARAHALGPGPRPCQMCPQGPRGATRIARISRAAAGTGGSRPSLRREVVASGRAAAAPAPARCRAEPPAHHTWRAGLWTQRQPPPRAFSKPPVPACSLSPARSAMVPCLLG